MGFGEFIGSGQNTTKLLLHLNGNSNDESGNGNNGTDTAISYGKQYGKFNKGAYFNGSTSNIAISSCPIDPTGFTIIAWRYLINASTYRCIFSKTNSNQPNPVDIYVISGTNTISFWVGDGTGTTGTKSVNVANSVIFNKWQCWMFTLDSNKVLNVYVDGKYLGTSTAVVPIADSSNNINLGIRADGVTKMYGRVDDTIVEKKVWTFQEYQKYYTNALGRF